ncbi:hypothetical protein LNO36_18665 [Klebsiella variicola subsp. variicola]|nr:hypothetical protein [Klebsiella variicola subsp. variicola]
MVDTHPFVLDGHRIRDVGYYPELSLTGILQKSSDTGVSHLSLAMPVQHLLDTYQAFGFGEPTGLGLTGESAGLMPHRRYWGSWIALPSRSAAGLMVTPLSWRTSTRLSAVSVLNDRYR